MWPKRKRNEGRNSEYNTTVGKNGRNMVVVNSPPHTHPNNNNNNYKIKEVNK